MDFYDNLIGRSGISSLFLPSSNSSQFRKIKVKISTLDQYCFNHRKPNFIKIDVEGAEKQVIEGGFEIFKNTNPIVVMEIWKNNNKNHLEAVKILQTFGYKIHLINEDGELEQKTVNFNQDIKGETDNFVFLKYSK